MFAMLVVAGASADRAFGACGSTVAGKQKKIIATGIIDTELPPVSCRANGKCTSGFADSLGGTVRSKCRTTKRCGGCGTSGVKRVSGIATGSRKSCRTRDRRNWRDDWEEPEKTRSFSSTRAQVEDLLELHDLQLKLVQNSRNNRRHRREATERRIRELAQELIGTVAHIENFPYPDRLDDMENVIGDIISGKLKSEFPVSYGMTPEKLLLAIQKAQLAKFNEYQKTANSEVTNLMP